MEDTEDLLTRRSTDVRTDVRSPIEPLSPSYEPLQVSAIELSEDDLNPKTALRNEQIKSLSLLQSGELERDVGNHDEASRSGALQAPMLVVKIRSCPLIECRTSSRFCESWCLMSSTIREFRSREILCKSLAIRHLELLVE